MQRGKLTIIVADPSWAKAKLRPAHRGGDNDRWGLAVNRERCRVGDVLVLSAGDDPAGTLRSRLKPSASRRHSAHFVCGGTSTIYDYPESTNAAWEIPVLAKYGFSGSQWKPFLEAGPSYRSVGTGTNFSHVGITAGVGTPG